MQATQGTLINAGRLFPAAPEVVFTAQAAWATDRRDAFLAATMWSKNPTLIIDSKFPNRIKSQDLLQNTVC